MIVKVLGSSGSRIQGQQTSCLQIDDNIIVDAGGITAKLSLEEQIAIDHVLVSHAHLDHIYDLAFLADNVMTERTQPLSIWGPQEVLNILRKHLFNNQIWPDLTNICWAGFPVIKMCPLEPNVSTEIGSLEISWAQTNHAVFSAGYLLQNNEAAVLYSGDTSTTEDIWALGKAHERLRMVFVETTFPDRLEDLAIKTGHLSPGLLARELEKLALPDIPVKVFHTKPQFQEEIRAELDSYGISCEILLGNEYFDLSA